MQNLCRSCTEIKLCLQGGPKNWHHFLCALTLPYINRFSKLFYCQNQEKISSNTVTKDPTTPQVCRYTTLWNVRCLKSNIENETTSVTIQTHFKKVTTGNNVFIVSVIVYTTVTVTSCSFYIKCSMCPSCCWTTHSSRRRHWWPMAHSMKRCDSLPHSVTTHLRCDGIFSDSIITNFLLILIVK